MNTIVTKFLGPSNFRGSRIVAVTDAPGGRVTVPYPHERRTGEDAHRLAAETLAARLGWTPAEGYPDLIGGYLPDGRYVFVFGPAGWKSARCKGCDAPMYVTVPGHHHTEDGRDVTR